MTRVWTPDMPYAKFVDVYAGGEKLEHCVCLVGDEAPGVEVKGEVEVIAFDKYGSMIVIDGEVMRTKKTCLVRWEWKDGVVRP